MMNLSPNGRGPLLGRLSTTTRTNNPTLQFLWYCAGWGLRELQAAIELSLHLVAFTRSQPGAALSKFRLWLFKKLFNPVTVLVAVWMLVLYWGEVLVFDNHVTQCDWPNWTDWKKDVTPHRLVFVADPQLIDPHTYPGRPWPLSTLTMKHTDMYLRRSYSRIQRDLDPDTIMFLGDLFDGGREWSTPTSQSVDYRWRGYGQEYWLEEFHRFSDIFFREWSSEEHKGRRLIASLPGNHDLGFGGGIQRAVRDRFHAHFGDPNRVDIIGNHTFVSIDTVSLSAAEQKSAQPFAEIWRYPQEFLDKFTLLKSQAITRHLRHLFSNLRPSVRSEHTVVDVSAPVGISLDGTDNRLIEDADYPTILLSHVPLYRGEGTPCGPLREKYPPTNPPPGTTAPKNPDQRNAIPIRAGYQYQNVLSGPISSHIIDSLGGTVDFVFSGDDHDFCEVDHFGYKHKGNGIREITVKSISWAMGVRRPGFVMISLWNPVDSKGKTLRKEGDLTMMTHLCLLPDQLSIFMWYVALLAVTILALVVRALLCQPETTGSRSRIGDSKEKVSSLDGPFKTLSGLPSSTTHRSTYASRSSTAPSPVAQDYEKATLYEQAGTFRPSRPARNDNDSNDSFSDDSDSDFDDPHDGDGRRSGRRRARQRNDDGWTALRMFLSGVKHVGCVALAWYLQLTKS